MSGVFATALARAEAFLLDPPDTGAGDLRSAPPERRTVVAVFGLGRRCGTTTVARALAAELAVRDPEGAAAVATDVPDSGLSLALPAATRLARALADLPRARTRALGRLCLVEGPEPLALADGARELAPLVLDAGNEHLGGVAASVADHVLIVAGPQTEPALGRAAVECTARVARAPLLVLNRAETAREDAVVLPNSRLGARLALGGREPRGALGDAIAGLADRVM